MSYRYAPTTVAHITRSGRDIRSAGRTPSAERRFPFEPLFARSGATTLLGFARQTGEHYRQVQRWRAYGLLWDHADRVACAIGLNPVSVWPDWHEGAA